MNVRGGIGLRIGAKGPKTACELGGFDDKFIGLSILFKTDRGFDLTADILDCDSFEVQFQ